MKKNKWFQLNQKEEKHLEIKKMQSEIISIDSN
jgi:hypothetical protein